MSYCLRLSCRRPYNPPDAKFCQHCGARLLLGDRYRAFQQIGSGHASQTFLGVDTRKFVDARCIIKAFDVTTSADAVRKEVEQLEYVRRHPCIPTLFAYFERDDVLYFVQEFIDGINLKSELAARGAFAEAQIWDVLADVLAILAFLHDHHIIHRNIKPVNLIRRSSDQQLVLVDFGSAKYTTPSELLKTGTLIGSAEYAPLEQLMGRTVFASDLYSLGVTCVNLLTGLTPFELFNPADGTWVWQSVSGPISSALTRLLTRLLERNVSDRYSSIAEVMVEWGDHLYPHGPPPSVNVTPAHVSVESAISSEPDQTSSPRQWAYRQTIVHEGGLTAFAFTPNGRILLTGGNDAIIRLWDVGAERCIYTLTEHRSAISAIAVSPDSQTLASSSWDQTIRLWQLETGAQNLVLSSRQPEVTALAIAAIDSPTDVLGRASTSIYRLASAGRNRVLNLWRLDTGAHCAEFRDHQAAIEVMAVSRDQPILASGDASGAVYIWHVGTQERLRALSRHDASVNAIAISTSHEMIATGSADTTVRLRQLNTGGNLHKLTGHLFPVSAIAVSPDGDYLAAGSYDGVVKLWALKTGECIQTLNRHTKPIVAIAFDHLNDNLVSGSRDGVLHIWRAIANPNVPGFGEPLLR